MGRSANYTIQGFLYQFNKTLDEILQGNLTDVVTVEGIIEDVEVATATANKAIQCKYHETQSKFNMSAIYEPLLQMLEHFHFNSKGKVDYVLFAHFPNLTEIVVTKEDLTKALESKNRGLQKHIERIKGKVDLSAFLAKFKAEVGPSFDQLVEQVQIRFERAGINKTEAQTLTYPNALHIIGNLARQPKVKDRGITKKGLLAQLKAIKSTVISEWTLALSSRAEVLKKRRTELKPGLSLNTRTRYLVIDHDSLEDFDNQIVLFIKEFVDKYSSKPAHLTPPTVCIGAPIGVLQSIELRLLESYSIVCNTGITANKFIESRFLRQALVSKAGRDFSLYLLGKENIAVLNKKKPDDLFVLGKSSCTELKTKDVNIEVLAAEEFSDIRYLLGINDVIA